MIYDTIRQDLKEAMKAKDKEKLDVLRGILTDVTNELVATGRTPQETLKDEEMVAIIQRASKRRKDSVEQFRKAGREDLASTEERELVHLEKYLPEEMSREEIKQIALAKKEVLGVKSKADANMLMGVMMKDLKGKADGKIVRSVIEEILD